MVDSPPPRDQQIEKSSEATVAEAVAAAIDSEQNLCVLEAQLANEEIANRKKQQEKDKVQVKAEAQEKQSEVEEVDSADEKSDGSEKTVKQEEAESEETEMDMDAQSPDEEQEKDSPDVGEQCAKSEEPEEKPQETNDVASNVDENNNEKTVDNSSKEQNKEEETSGSESGGEQPEQPEVKVQETDIDEPEVTPSEPTDDKQEEWARLTAEAQRQLAAGKILGAAVRNERRVYLIEWTSGGHQVLTDTEVKRDWPQLLIQFYEKNIHWIRTKKKNSSNAIKSALSKQSKVDFKHKKLN